MVKIFFPNLQKVFEVLSKTYNGDFSRNQFVITQRFAEYFFRLQHRYKLLLEVESELLNASPKFIRRPLQEIQLSFVNELEGFFEQFYATLSSLSALLIGTTADNYFPTTIMENNESLLNHLKTFWKDDRLKLKVDKLKIAKDFRNKIIHYKDKVQQDWMNFTYYGNFGRECVVIFYVAKGPEIYFKGFQNNPYADNFTPPVNYESFYVSPSHKETYQSFCDIIVYVLEEITRDISSRPKIKTGVDIKKIDAQFAVLPKRLYSQMTYKKESVLDRAKNKLKKLFKSKKQNGNQDKEGFIVKETFRHK